MLIRYLMPLVFCAVSIAAEPATTETAAKAPEPNLEEQLERLNAPSNQPTPGIAEEKLYSLQDRFSPLKHRHEVSLSAGNNFTADSFLVSRHLSLGYRFYWNNRLYTGLSGSTVFNDFTEGGKKILPSLSQFADTAVTKQRADLLMGYHLFYGKFRLSMDRVLYLDQYLALGPGYVNYTTGSRWGIVGELGLVFWFGRNFTARVSLKDYFVNEPRILSSGWEHNLLGSLEAGWVFGG